MQITSHIAQVVRTALDWPVERTAQVEDALTAPPNAALGDVAFPCFQLAKELRSAPNLIAKDLAGEDRPGPDHRERPGRGALPQPVPEPGQRHGAGAGRDPRPPGDLRPAGPGRRAHAGAGLLRAQHRQALPLRPPALHQPGRRPGPDLHLPGLEGDPEELHRRLGHPVRLRHLGLAAVGRRRRARGAGHRLPGRALHQGQPAKRAGSRLCGSRRARCSCASRRATRRSSPCGSGSGRCRWRASTAPTTGSGSPSTPTTASPR